jgi:hypothetical protein
LKEVDGADLNDCQQRLRKRRVADLGRERTANNDPSARARKVPRIAILPAVGATGQL